MSSSPSGSGVASTLGERPHADRMVCMRTYAQGAVIEKVYSVADADAIFISMSKLWASSFGSVRCPSAMPQPLGVDGPVITMSFVPGVPLGIRGSLGTTLQHLPAVASVLADFHSSRVEVPRLRHPERLLRSLDRKAKQVAPSLNDSFQTVISQCLRPIAPVGDPLVVTHGDFSPRNLLSDGSNLVLIDFDRLQMAGRGRDLGYFGAWVWVTEFMNEPTTNPSWAVADELISLYSELTEITESSLRQTAPFYRAAALLRIAQSWSALGDRPDLSRVIIETAAKVSGEKP
jgi:aminoglycoside phosphotransferase (APT) family kinase protein